jgi:hypothetical protein
LGGALLVCSAGLLPFLTGAARISGGEHSSTGIGAVVALVPRVIGHPANMVSLAAAVLFFASLAVLLLLSLGRIGVEISSGFSKGLRNPLAGIAIALASGVLVTLLAAVLAQGFDPLKPSYSGWMLPLVAVLASAALAPVRQWKLALVAALLGGALWGASIFVANARFFVHGPERSINEAIGRDVSSSSVIYVGPDWAYAYFPLSYEYNGGLAQWLLGSDGRLHQIRKGGAVEDSAAPWTALSGARTVVVVGIDTRSFKSLRNHDGGKPLPLGRLVGQHLPGMALASEYTRPGLYSSQLAIFRKAQ